MKALEIVGVEKEFGKTKILKGVNFDVPEHSVFGFLGQNGAGKTTTMKIVLGLLKPDAGLVRVFGEPVSYGETKTNRMIGYLPDVPEFYGYMTPKEYLRLCGEIAGMSGHDIKVKSENLLELVGLKECKKRIGAFSRGMKQRLGIAQALLNEPQLLICDEPTSALDPVGRKEILDILSKVKERTTVVFSTHILSDVERICDQIAILHNGTIAMSGELKELKARYAKNQLELVFRNEWDKERFMEHAKMQEYGKSIQEEELHLFIEDTDAAGEILNLLSASQLVPIKFEQKEATLEKLFLEVVQ